MEKIFAEIRDNVEKEVDKLLSMAKRVAEREIKYAEIEAGKIISEQKLQMQLKSEKIEEREELHNSVDDKKTELEQYQHFVDEIFKMALEKIKNIPRDEKYEAWIKKLLIAGLKNFNDNNVVIYSSKKDSEIIKKIASELEVNYSKDYLDIETGIVLKSDDGRMTVDLSENAILNNNKDDLRGKIISKLNFND